MTPLSPQEKQLLADLSQDPTWRDLLDKLGEFHRDIPTYKPKGDSPDVQERDWIYRSGVDYGSRALLKQLRNE